MANKSVCDKKAAYELSLYADNKEIVLKQCLEPIINNLHKKWKKGIFDKEKAVKAFVPAMDFAAKVYMNDFGIVKDTSKVFNKATREEAARMITEYNMESIEEGLYEF